MLLAKRVLCSIIGLFFVVLGALMTNNSFFVWQILGFCVFVVGVTLAYIAIKQTLPNYSFWVTLIAIGLAYALLITKINFSFIEDVTGAPQIDSTPKKDNAKHQKKTPKQKTKTKKSDFKLAAYPKITGSITVIHAHVFYINGRYVKLYGVDAPDSDQLCADSAGSSYNCGEVAASWVRNWIDNNVIDCYLLKVEPRGYDLATCIWGDYDIGAGLVGAGWGLADTRETNIYKPYEAKAQGEASGLWSGTFYLPEDWRNIKRHQNDFTIKRTTRSRGKSFFNFKSWF